MRRSLFVSVEEQLEIEKLEESRRIANRSGHYETLFDNLAQQQKVQEESDDPVDEDSPEETDVDTTEAMESIGDFSFSLEEYNEQHWGNKPALSNRLMGAVSELGILGIKYTPVLLKTMFKGVLYAFGVLGELFMKSSSAIVKYLDRRSTSFDKLLESIESLNKSLNIVKDDSGLNGQLFTEEPVINSLKIGSNVDFVSNIKTLNTFTKDVIGSIEKQVELDIGQIKHTISVSSFSNTSAPVNILTVKPFSTKLKPGRIAGFSSDEETTVSYLYSERLPSDIALMAFLPKNTQTVQEASRSYDASKVILGFDNSNFKAIGSVDYMSVEELKSLLKELKGLCDLCVAQKTFYEQLLVSKKQIRFGLQSYFTRISSANRKISIKESLVEYVYLKSLFIDKVYLASCINIHDYNAKTIAMALKFIEAHVKKLA